jgi:DNA-binding CsgD family transcriptional regulator
MSRGPAAPDLIGRATECEALDRLLDGARAGHGAALVLRGEAGIGKTALLRHLQQQASGCLVVRAAGVESEMEFVFAGLHQFCAPLLDRIDHLPGPQREALEVAFGLAEGETPERFLVGLAVLTLLSEAAEERPVLCLIDDAQWLDRASAQMLAFIARRLLAERIAMLFAVREPSSDLDLARLPQLAVAGIDHRYAGTLLDSALQSPLDERVRATVLSESHGNPLALLELPRSLTPTEIAGGFGVPRAKRVTSRIEHAFTRRLSELPADTRRLLLLAAAEPLGDAALLARAAGLLGIAPDAVAPAEAEGLIDQREGVRFRHPLMRSAAYRSASVSDRHAAHAALAAATDAAADPDHHVWHRAQATSGWDEDVAAELERSAGRARSRAGVAAAAAFLERATELTPDEERRGDRAIAAAQAKFAAAAPQEAERLLAVAQMGPLDELRRTRLERLRAQIAFGRSRGGDAAPLLLEAARHLAPLDAALARETYLEAFASTIFAGPLGGAVDAARVAAAARDAPAAPDPPRAIDALLDGLIVRYSEGYVAALAPLRAALAAFGRPELGERDARWLWLACWIAPDVWDDDGWLELARRGVEHARAAGVLSVLPVALTFYAGATLHCGRLADASALVAETAAITDVTGQAPLAYGAIALAAWRGQEQETARLAADGIADATARGEGRAISTIEYARAVLLNAQGRHREALACAERAAVPNEFGVYGWALQELVEAGAGCGEPALAADAYARLHVLTAAGATEWALGIDARCRALISDGAAAEALFHEAIERLERCHVATHLMRAHLLYGEWLRREKRRVDAREQLRHAHTMALELGAAAFAARAAQELLSAGETARAPADTAPDLTVQEAQIAQLVGEELTNSEIGARLFLSPRTVEWHLSKVFTKTGVASRHELAAVLDRRGFGGPAAAGAGAA